MTFSLPRVTNHLKKIYIKAQRKNKSSAFSERHWSLLTISLASLCLFLIILSSIIPPDKLISPIVSTLQILKQLSIGKHATSEFAFAPGWAPDKFSEIDFQNLSVLAFFDLPVTEDGTIDQENDGYATFHSDDAMQLFTKAHQHGTKVVVTLSSVDNSAIRNILDSQTAQNELISEAGDEVKNAGADGVLVDFEYNRGISPIYKNEYSSFIKKLTKSFHQQIPNSLVAVAVGNSNAENSLYDTKKLANASDRIFFLAYNLAVPEQKGSKPIAPIYGYNQKDYFNDLTSSISFFSKDISSNKLVYERAWYGNGNNYPLYISNQTVGATIASTKNTLKTPLAKVMISALVANVANQAKAAARKNLPLIAKALEKEGILNSNVLAYALATIEHETAGTFEPIDEINGRKSARRLGYEGGTDYFGRGFIQLTHLRNYLNMGKRIGVGDNLAKNPQFASQADIAAAILAAYFKDNHIADLATQGDFYDARKAINPDAQAGWIAYLAETFLYGLG